MGTSKTPMELADKFQVMSKLIPGANTDAVAASALVYKNGVLAAARSDVGGDLRMSWSGRNLKLGARFQTYSKGASSFAILTPRPAGVWSVLSNGSEAHDIYAGAKRPGRKRRNGKKQLKIGGQFAGVMVPHPGTPGKRTWQKGIKAAETPARRVNRLAYSRTLSKVFR